MQLTVILAPTRGGADVPNVKKCTKCASRHGVSCTKCLFANMHISAAGLPAVPGVGMGVALCHHSGEKGNWMAATQNGNYRKRTTNDRASGRRTQLLAIAAELFATRGYTQTTVRDIADSAGILSGSLYHHFKSKEAMLSEILQTFLTDLQGDFDEIVEQQDAPGEALEGLVRSSFAMIHAYPHAVALYQNEASLLGHLPQFDFVAASARDIEQLWLRVLDAGCKSGDFRKDVEINLVYRFIRDSIWNSVRWYNPRGRLQHQKVADQYISMLHGGLLTA